VTGAATAPPAEKGLHVEVHDGGGPPMLLLHGILSSRANWLPNLPALRQVATPVVVELWGHGRSPAPPEAARCAPAGYVEELERIRMSLGIDCWFVCGLSLGAALTLRYSLDHPEHVLGQVFTNSNSALAGPEWRQRMPPLVEADARRIEERGRDAIRAHPLNPSRGRRLPEAARAALVADCELHDPIGVAATLRHTVPDSPVRERARETSVPTLLVVGEREGASREARAFAERTIARLRVVPTPAGHAVNLESQQAFDAAVSEFVGEVARVRRGGGPSSGSTAIGAPVWQGRTRRRRRWSRALPWPVARWRCASAGRAPLWSEWAGTRASHDSSAPRAAVGEQWGSWMCCCPDQSPARRP
jgi:2-succinyl-6-hydroxy-2,4-cyclohexadiene-1-carboxylate synthase